MTVVLIKVAFFFSLISQADTIPVQEKIYTVSEISIKPTPAKGLTNFHDRWSKSVAYPEDALKEKVQGMVFIQFVVNNDGTVTDAAIKQGIGHGCDEAALKGFEELCKEPWIPGVKHDQPVKVSMVLPFYFRIIERP
jgi:protein TonB